MDCVPAATQLAMLYNGWYTVGAALLHIALDQQLVLLL